MKSSIIRSTLLFAILVSLYSCHKDARRSVAFKNRDKTWTEFRDNFPYNMQVVGIEEFNEDDSYNIVVSEPPESLDTTELQKIVKNDNGTYEVKTHQMGVDGWVKDIVITIAGIGDPDSFTKKINKLLYGTDYKSYYLHLPLVKRPASYLSEEQNLDVTAVELKKWLIEGNESFYDAADPGQIYKISDLMGQSKMGVFYSVRGGLVVWALAKGGDITDKNEEIRKYVVDSDLLLGAIASDNMLFIIGRERQNNVIDMPPLRLETVQLLASANKTELAQSYERNSFGAGKISGGKDWAPIYLSDELKNTEYGSILNITDQMLKSWSENGLITYTNFKVSKPDYWAFNNGAISDLKANELTYNWNTKAAVYALNDGDLNFVALSHNGSLPVSYIPKGVDNSKSPKRIIHAEASAYNFFSGLNNPYLIRVNQYAALYQIFSTFGITSSYNTAHGASRSDNTNNAAVADTTIASDSTAAPESSIIKDQVKNVFKQIISGDNNDLKKKMLSNTGLFLEILEFARPLDTIKNILKDVSSHLGDDGLSKLADFVANPRKSLNNLTSEDSTIIILGSYINRYSKQLADLYVDDKKGLYQQYVSSYKNNFGHWIKTPSAVLSWSNRDSTFETGLTGGHNIDPRIVPLEVDKNLVKGEFRIVEENGIKKIIVAEGDLGNISSGFLREVEDSKMTGLMNMPADAETIVPRLREEVIAPIHRDVRGLSPEQITVSKLNTGYVVNGKHVDNCKDMIDELVTYANTAKPKQLSITFKNTTADEANVIVKSTDVRLSTQGVLDEGNVFRITGHKYDFEKSVINDTGDGVEIIIPALEYKSEASLGIPTCNTVSTKISVRNLFGNLKTRVTEIVHNLRQKFITEKVPGSMDFFAQMKAELLKNGVKQQDIIAERQDCIICMANPYDWNGYYKNYQAA